MRVFKMKCVSEHVEILGKVKEVFDEIGVVFWLDNGTLLGAMREGKIIEWDNDIDLGVHFKDIEKIVSNESKFKKRNLQVNIRRKYGTMHAYRNGYGISFILFRVTQDNAWALFPSCETKTEKLFAWVLGVFTKEMYGESKYDTQKRKFINHLPLKLRNLIVNITWFIMKKRGYIKHWVIPKHFFMQLSTIEFYGLKFNIPSKVEEYLKFRYGDTWETPNKNWVWFRDDGACKFMRDY